jgi:thiol-disulfide isomerase/thioredoxin
MTNCLRFVCSMCLVGSIFFGVIPWWIVTGTPAAQTRQPESAAALVKRALDLADRDRPEEGIIAIKKAIAIAPADVAAHSAYIRIATYYLNRYDDVRREYEKLILSDPRNPVYPMALAHGAYGATTAAVNRARFETVSALAPDSAWGHYAKAQLLMAEQPELAAAELEESLKQDSTLADAYSELIALQDRRLAKPDAAIATAERMAAQPGLRPAGLVALWRLRLAKAKRSEEAKQNLRTELERLSADTRDVALLAAVRTAYASLLDDAQARDAIERRIRQIDATWIWQRGLATFFGPSNISGVARHDPLAGRQFMIFGKVRAIGDALPTAERILKLEEVLLLKPGPVMQRYIYEELFTSAEKAKDATRLVKYGNRLRQIDPTDVAVPARIALLLADRPDTQSRRRALGYGRSAADATAVFQPMTRPLNMDPARFQGVFSEATQRQIYAKQRSLALHALGWALCQTGNCAEGETQLAQAVDLDRSEETLSHWAVALRKAGRPDEGDRVAREAAEIYAESIRKRLTSQPAPDFQLERLSGGTIKLSDLKGKVVLLNFWATYCGPCQEEMPHLTKIYERYRNRGLEILAITTDERSDRSKVASFVDKFGLTFPVLYDDGTAKAYNVNGMPTTVYIDAQGRTRYHTTGFYGDDTIREQEVVINELLKGISTPPPRFDVRSGAERLLHSRRAADY